MRNLVAAPYMPLLDTMQSIVTVHYSTISTLSRRLRGRPATTFGDQADAAIDLLNTRTCSPATIVSNINCGGSD
jgi:hypothetical protein